MEFLLGLFTAYVLTWPGLVALFLLGIIFEANEAHGWAMFTALASAITAYFFFAVPLSTIAIASVGYFVIGFVWSIWRYKRHAMKVVQANLGLSERSRASALEQLHPTKMLGKLTTWVMIWPFSMFENVIGDLITLVQTTISKFLRGIYHSIYASAVKQLAPASEEQA